MSVTDRRTNGQTDKTVLASRAPLDRNTYVGLDREMRSVSLSCALSTHELIVTWSILEGLR